MLTPTISFPDDLMSSGTVFAISSTFWADAAVVPEAGALDWVLVLVPLAQPDRASAPVAANTAAMRQSFVRRS
jgi:hypothetical protein